jgi:hypothetical protein
MRSTVMRWRISGAGMTPRRRPMASLMRDGASHDLADGMNIGAAIMVLVRLGHAGQHIVANDGLAIGHQGQQQGFGGIFRRQEDLFFHPAMMTGVADFSTRTCGPAETAATACRA